MQTKQYQLPKEFATKWVEALRSGKYKQTKGNYIDGECFCAVGLGFKINNWEVMPGHIQFMDRVIKIGLECKIMELNDEFNYEFPEIAAWIEQNVEFI